MICGRRRRPLYIDGDGNSNPLAAIFFVVFIIIVGPMRDGERGRERERERERITPQYPSLSSLRKSVRIV